MKLSQVAFVFRRVFKSMRELFWTHILTSVTMAMTLFILGGFLLLQKNLHGWLKGWGDQVQIFAYLDDHLSPADLKGLQQRIRSYPEVERVHYVSRVEAWKDFKKALEAQSGMLEGLTQDILPASLEIALKKTDRKRASVEDLANQLYKLKGVREVEYPGEWMEKLSLLVLSVQWAKWILGGVLFIATLLIVGSTVKLAILARRNEIEIMQLVGATEGVIKAPFIIEGMIQGVLGASLSLFLLWLLFFFLSIRLASSFDILPAQGQYHFLDSGGIAFLLFLGWLMGAGGTLFSLRRFLKTWGR
ncbi:MAG: permease-like cell division protein FtsX [Candidatus Binatia bacterium]